MQWLYLSKILLNLFSSWENMTLLLLKTMFSPQEIIWNSAALTINQIY